MKRVGPGLYRGRKRLQCPKTGKRFELDRLVRATSKPEAERQFAEEVRKAEAGHGAVERIRLCELIDAWRAARGGSWSPGMANHADHYLGAIKASLGNYFVDALDPDDVRQYLAGLEPSASGWTLRHHLRWLRRLDKVARERGYRVSSFTADVVVRKPTRRYTDEQPNSLTPPQLAAFLQALRAECPQWYPMVLTFAITGLRFSSIAALKWEDVDESAETITFRRRLSGRAVLDGDKTGKVIKHWAPPLLLDALREHRRLLVAAQYPGLAEGWVFPSEVGEPHHGGVLTKPFKKALRAAGLSIHLTPHGLRRTWNAMLKRVTDGDVVRALIGHTTEAMSTHYNFIDLDQRKAAVGRAMALLAGTNAGTQPQPSAPTLARLQDSSQ